MQHRFETTVCTLKAIPCILWDENKTFRGDESRFSAHELQIYQILFILLTTPCKLGYPYDEWVKKWKSDEERERQNLPFHSELSLNDQI